MRAGSPTATHPIGTVAPGARRVRRWTVACTLTSLPRPSAAPWKIAAPVATNTSSSRVAPVTWALGPIRQWSPIVQGCLGLARITAFSMMIASRPMRMAPPASPTRRAPCRMRTPGPIVTSPHTVASGATQAVGSIVGRFPACSISIVSYLRRDLSPISPTLSVSFRTDPISSSIGGGNKRLFVPFADGIVTPDPVGVAVHAAFAGGDRLLLRRAVAHVLEAGIGEGEPLHPMHARDADAAEIGKGLDRIAASLEPAREDVGVLESLAGALPGIGQHGVRCVADELYATAAPILRQRPREEAPF